MTQPIRFHSRRPRGNADGEARDVRSLVQPGRVHSSVFTDGDVFDQEIERIFHGTWLYIGHTSEVPRHGDYRTRRMGRQPVLMMRGGDGQVRVLMNRCRHRGAAVCEGDAGNTKHLRCWFHGWIYDATGKLVEVPGREAYCDDFDQDAMSLAAPPRVGEYRGFVFASLNPDVPNLETHLGHAKAMIDLMVDASPDGAICINAGVHKTVYRGNWKLVGMDGYHVHYVHASVIAAWNRDPDAGLAATHRGDPFDDESASRTRDLGNGHVMLDLTAHRLSHYEQFSDMLRKTPGGEEYLSRMRGKHGEERARLLVSLAGDPHVGIYPNLQLINNQIRIINPIAPDECEVIMFPVLFEGVSQEINALRIRQHESFYGPAGSGSPDDGEIFERAQCGMMAQVMPWLELSRGLNREEHGVDGVITGRISDEVTQRGQMRRWLELMSAEGEAR
ncbi:aromatic ring-hydroxylating oxygenase subunit alpha [Cupriavidus necator]|uniref:aromatic ring-hydroxylating oxygenase subunit alpha n=1 Tax=Cupriavidus necator TaxID=106590 RepID=UPI000690613C|nr:aromatic ring-hydroxylating dioxygenase subunit alpha [Cupriavidus necator]